MLTQIMEKLITVESQNAQLSVQANAAAEDAKKREEALMREINLLKQAKVRVAPSTTQELLDYVANEFQQVAEGFQEVDQQYVNTWINVANFYRLDANLKQAFTKVLAGDVPDRTAVEFAPLVAALTKAVGSSSGRGRSEKGKKCAKCGRTSHDSDKCYAKTHVNGTKLE
jgi:hypothetical protein